jgi:2-methylcitrate synthase
MHFFCCSFPHAGTLACFSFFLPSFSHRYHFAFFGKRIDTAQKSSRAGAPVDTVARNFMRLLRNDGAEPDDAFVRAIDVSLILYAEHGFAASTFACRVTISTQSDVYSGLAAAIGTLRGSLHGGANEAAMHLIERFASADEAEKAVRSMWSKKELVYGFGHAIYKKGDPRSNIIKEASRALTSHPKLGKPNLFAVSERIEALMINEKKIFPNLGQSTDTGRQASACNARRMGTFPSDRQHLGFSFC